MKPLPPPSRWLCPILVVGWALPGVLVWAGAAGRQSPFPPGWVYSLPSLAAGIAVVAAPFLVLMWTVLPVSLLAIGLEYVRGVTRRGSRWRIAWIASVVAGIVLEALMVPLFQPSTAVPNWGAAAEALGFATAGGAMIAMLIGARRSKGPDGRSRTAFPGPTAP